VSGGARQKRHREKRKAAGLCVRCGKYPICVAKSTVHCLGCVNKVRVISRDIMRRRREEGTA
jgi:hypothetical protein